MTGTGTPRPEAEEQARQQRKPDRLGASSVTTSTVTWPSKRRIAPKGCVHPRLSLEPRAEHNGSTRFSPTPRASAARRVQGFEVVAPPGAGADGAHDRRARGGVTWPHPGGCRPRACRGNGRRTKNGDPKVLPLLSTLQLEHFRLYSGAVLRDVASQVRRLWITLCLVEPRQESSLVFTRLRLRKYYLSWRASG